MEGSLSVMWKHTARLGAEKGEIRKLDGGEYEAGSVPELLKCGVSKKIAE